MEKLFGKNEGGVNPALPAMAALLSELALIIADIDSSREGTATSILDRLDKDLDKSSETFPILLVEQEQKLNEYRQAFRNAVEQTKEELRALNKLAEALEDDTPTPHPADVVAEGATGRAILVLIASLSLAIERSPVDKETFLAFLETFLRNGIREYGTRPPETDWILEILDSLRV